MPTRRRNTDVPQFEDTFGEDGNFRPVEQQPRGSRLRRMARATRDELLPREGAGPTIGNSLVAAVPQAGATNVATRGGLGALSQARNAPRFRPNQTVTPTAQGFRNQAQVQAQANQQIRGNVVQSLRETANPRGALFAGAGVAAAADLGAGQEDNYTAPARPSTDAASTTAAETLADTRSFTERATSGEAMTQADFDAAGFGGEGLRVDGNRQGTVPQWMDQRMGGSQAGLRQSRGGPGQAQPAVSNFEMQNIMREARWDESRDRSAASRIGSGLSPGRRDRLRQAALGDVTPAAQRAQAMINARLAATSPGIADQTAIGLREEARQANQREDTAQRGQDLNFQADREGIAQRERDSQRRLMAQGLRGDGRQGGDSVLGPGGNYSPEAVRSQADTMARGIFSDLSRSNVGVFESEEETAAALDGFFQRAGTQQASGELPQWVDDTMGRDLFTLAAALSATERRGGLGGLFGMTRGRRGQPELNPADTLRLITEMVQNEGGNKWTRVGGQQFNLSKLEGNSARLYESLASRLRPMLEQEGE